jgi:DNA mismatch repair ATPase MutS
MIAWAFLNGIFLWDILQMLRLENWQKKNREKAGDWFDVIAETDALNSLANYYFNNDEYIFPEINDGEFSVKAVNLGHPLINKSQLVGNDVDIRKGEFIIVTGANMAGKSTYLRTVGVNLVLAMAGAPVCAGSYIFRPIRLFTSIRTSDSLTDNESYFYAELKRLKRIIDEIKSGKEVFIILDEILKGTNSKDKHSGSEALLKQLIQYKATGIIATHDVALGILEKTFPENIKNLCFEVDITSDKLTFDYKLRPGVSRNMNATILMRQMGITV